MRVIIALLTPMFLTACGGDTSIARLAAFGTIKQYNPRSYVEFICVAQIIACGLASAASVGLSFHAEFSAAMTLRLRANAVALSRAADRASRALAEPPRPPAPELRAPEPPSLEQQEYEAKVLADVAAAQARTREAMARLNVAQPKADAAPIPAQSPAPAPMPSPVGFLTNEQWEAAGAMTDVSDEFTADLQNLPPAEREEATRKAAILSGVANKLLASKVPPRLRPGDANPTA